MDECIYSKNQVCEMLGITFFTIGNWYSWQRKLIEQGEVSEEYLPAPEKRMNEKGRPLMWSFAMIEQLKAYQASIARGRSGIYGRFTNKKKH
ncbi:MAG: hypothetical protein K6G24_13940 [Lachnospiraceae bacterium]|nr:hypothetical protein [Lachnospiraceae bacterium]